MAALEALSQQSTSRNRRSRNGRPGSTQEALTNVRNRADHLRTQLAEEDFSARAQQVGELASERAHELEGTLRERLEELEPATRQAQVGVWKALRALFAGLVALPALLFRVLRAVAGTLDDVAERTDFEQRAKRAGEMLPARRAPRVRRRTALWWAAGGFVTGLAGGYALCRSQSREVTYDAPQPEYVDPVVAPAAQGDALRG